MSIAIAIDAHVASTARRQVTAALQDSRISDELRSDVILLVSEIVTNVARHEVGPKVNIDVALDTAGELTVTVTGGRNDPVPAFVAPPRLPAPSSETGRGLSIVDSLASTWGTKRSDGRTSVWFTIADAEGTDNTGTTAPLGASMAVADQSAAAAVVVAATALAAVAVESERIRAADTALAVAKATARELAADTVERAATTALAGREAAQFSQRLREANRLLTAAGLHDRHVAMALQEAMLTRLPESDSVLLASRYLTAAEEDQVGGDWYDAIVLPEGVTTLVIGDVVGHDIQAAAIMGQLRNILRAQILECSHPPSNVVGRLDRANRDLRIHTLATLIVINVEPPAPDDPLSVATLRWSNAGHPAPILVHADGHAIQLDTAADVLLGVAPDGTRHDHSHPVPSGATVLLYTDGLVETRTHTIDDGQRRLLEAVSAHHRLDPSAMLDAVLADMVSDQPRDDVAILAARFQDTRHSSPVAVQRVSVASG